MEIQTLSFLVTDDDLVTLLSRIGPDGDKIENLRARLTPRGVAIHGVYPSGFGFKVPFETWWQVEAAGPALRVTLADLKVAGLPAGILRGALLRLLGEAVVGQPGLLMQGEALEVAVAEVAAANGFALRVSFTAVRLGEGQAVIEAG